MKSCLFDLGLPTSLSVSYCSHLGELLLLSRRAAAPISASCCSSLGELLPLYRRAVAPLSASCCSFAPLSASCCPFAPLSASCCPIAPLSASCSPSIGELQLLSRRAAALFRSTSICYTFMLRCYCCINIFLKIVIFFETVNVVTVTCNP